MTNNTPPCNDERRRFPRLSVPILYRTSKKKGLARPIYNFSFGGVRIYTNRYLKEGKQLEIELCLPNEESIVATVQVVWIKALPVGHDAIFDVALEFLELPPDAVDKLKEVLESDSCD